VGDFDALETAGRTHDTGAHWSPVVGHGDRLSARGVRLGQRMFHMSPRIGCGPGGKACAVWRRGHGGTAHTIEARAARHEHQGSASVTVARASILFGTPQAGGY